MLHRDCFFRLVVGVLGVAAWLLAARPAGALCTELTDAVCPACCSAVFCPGPVMCVPPGPWGYTQRQWHFWPGGQLRQDIVFPQSLGVELVTTPRGETPMALPKEVYGPPRRKIDETRQSSPNIEIQDSSPMASGAPLPFELGPSLDQAKP
jgi:hypothetical protein